MNKFLQKNLLHLGRFFCWGLVSLYNFIPPLGWIFRFSLSKVRQSSDCYK